MNTVCANSSGTRSSSFSMLSTPSPSASFFSTGMLSRSSAKRRFRPASCSASTSSRDIRLHLSKECSASSAGSVSSSSTFSSIVLVIGVRLLDCTHSRGGRRSTSCARKAGYPGRAAFMAMPV
ncbi:hypothetical protein D9M71_780320 [compost metagenome]